MKMLMVKTSYLILFVVLISVGVTSAWHIYSTLRGDPVIVAVGDIACSNDSDHRDKSDRCHELQTSDLALSVNPDAVLLLGDLQYFDGKYEDFLGSYDPTSKTMVSSAIPDWIRSISSWWASGAISDKEFLMAIQYLVQNNIIIV